MIDQWAQRWGIDPRAVKELKENFGIFEQPQQVAGESEAAIQSRVRLEASQKGFRLWRNNVGACYDADNNFIRYGLANDSTKLNKYFKSSDLIGIDPNGRFVAREVKREGWEYADTMRERAQLAFITLVNSMGGDATFCTGTGTI